ncbi:hypothetical protein [Lysobacter gummosus]
MGVGEWMRSETSFFAIPHSPFPIPGPQGFTTTLTLPSSVLP